MGDFNAHIGSWQNDSFSLHDLNPEDIHTRLREELMIPPLRKSLDPKIDPRGRLFQQFMRNNNLWCLNGTTLSDPLGSWTYDLPTRKINPHTGQTEIHNRRSVLDLCLIDRETYPLKADFTVGDEELFTDHHPIILHLPTDPPSQVSLNQQPPILTSPPVTLHRGFHLHHKPQGNLWNHLDSHHLQALFRDSFSPSPSQDKINQTANHIIFQLQQAASLTLGIRKPPNPHKKQNKPWFDRACRISLQQSKKGEPHKSKYQKLIEQKRKAWQQRLSATLRYQFQKTHGRQFWRTFMGHRNRHENQISSLS